MQINYSEAQVGLGTIQISLPPWLVNNLLLQNHLSSIYVCAFDYVQSGSTTHTLLFQLLQFVAPENQCVLALAFLAANFPRIITH